MVFKSIRRFLFGDPDQQVSFENLSDGQYAANVVFRFNLTSLPEDIFSKIRSDSDIGINYDINLFEMTCSCPDFQKRRFKFEKYDVRRLCKHLIAELRRKKLFEQHDELTQIILYSRSAKLKMSVNYMRSGQAVVFCHDNEPLSWIDVFSRKRKKGETEGRFTGRYGLFGFSLEKNRWSYGEAPPGAQEIRAMIMKL